MYLHDQDSSFTVLNENNSNNGLHDVENTKFPLIAREYEYIIVFPQTTDNAFSHWNYGHTRYGCYMTGCSGDGGTGLNKNEYSTTHLTKNNRQAATLKRIIDFLVE